MKKSLAFSILTLAVLSFSGCSKEDNPSTDDILGKDEVYRISVSADKAAGTKALSLEERDGKNYLASYWKTSDKIYVYKGWEATSPTGTLSPKTEGKSSVLEGNITGSPKKGDYLVFTSPFASLDLNYTGQDGTLETIAQKYDYIRSDAYINSVEGSEISLDPLRFDAQQAIVKFTLVDAEGNPVYPTKLTLTAHNASAQDIMIVSGETKGDIVINIDQTTPHNEIYAALSMWGGTSASFFKIVASVGDAVTYEYTKTSETKFDNGKYYEIKVKLSNKTVIPDISLDNIKFNFSFLNNGTEWAKEGPIFVFFEGITTGYYLILHDNIDGWQEGDFYDLGGTNASDFVTNGKVTAVFLDGAEYLNSTTPVSYSSGKWVFNTTAENGFEGWNYVSANNVQYSFTAEDVSGTETVSLNASLNLIAPADPPIKIATDKEHSVKLACNYLIPAGLASVSADGTVNEVEGNAGDWINVITGGEFACARKTTPAAFIPNIYKPESVVYYYALQTNLNGNYSYFHLLDNNSSRLEVVDSYMQCAHISPGSDDWIQVGPGYFVELKGKTWWTTNLSNDRHSPLAHPWTTVELVWTTGNQWDSDRVSKSLSAATFDYNSELPEPFDWNKDGYIYQIISVCGIKGFVYGDLSDLTKFIFLPFADHSDFYFYADVGETELRYNYNWHYWARDYHPYLLYHRTSVPGYDDHYWAYHSTSTLHFPSYNDSFYPCYYGTDVELFYGSYGVPDYAIMNNDNQQLYFPARPVKKN